MIYLEVQLDIMKTFIVKDSWVANLPIIIDKIIYKAILIQKVIMEIIILILLQLKY